MVKERAEKEHKIQIELDPKKYLENKVDCSGSDSFADDLTVYNHNKDDKEAKVVLEIQAEEFKKYFAALGLKVNVKKNQHLVISRTRTLDNVIVEGRNEADQVKLLGVTFTKNFNFDPHINNITKKINLRVACLSKVKKFMNPKQFKTTCEAMAMSIIRYALEIYGSDHRSQSKLQKLENRILRLVTGCDQREPIRNMLAETGWLSIKNQQIKQRICLLMKALKGNVISSWEELLLQGDRKRRTIQATHDLRMRDLRIAWNPKQKLISRQSALIQAVKSFNDLNLNGRIFPKSNLSKKIGGLVKLHYGSNIP